MSRRMEFGLMGRVWLSEQSSVCANRWSLDTYTELELEYKEKSSLSLNDTVKWSASHGFKCVEVDDACQFTRKWMMLASSQGTG